MMNKKKIQFSVLLGIIAVLAIIAFQYLWFREAFNQEKRKFNQSVHIALLEVVKLLANENNSQLPQTNPVEKISDDYFLVRINEEINAEILEFYLKNEFEKLNIQSDFEYAIYDCSNDEMVYGNYVNYDQKGISRSNEAFFPKIDNLVYYFAVRFPNQPVFFSKPTGTWTIISILSLVVLAIYIYSIFVILRQNRYAELQTDFINNMTHEFKTPISSIMLASQFLSGNSVITKDERLKKYSEAINHQSQRLNQHVERILSIAKSEKNSLKPEIKPVVLIECIQKILDQFRSKCEAKISFQFDCQDHNKTVSMDENHFVNVMNNLLDNACKYSRGTPDILVWVNCEHNQIKIGVKDHGMGIPKMHQSKVFDKFYRIPRENSDPITGFGLGLHYVKQVCQQHKWDISLSSEIKKGTEVVITIHQT